MSTRNFRTSRRWTTDEARDALEAWRKSGLPIDRFSLDEGLDPQRVRRWHKVLSQPDTPGFALVRVVDPQDGRPRDQRAGEQAAAGDGARMEIVVGDHVRIRVGPGFDPAALRRLIDTVAAC